MAILIARNPWWAARHSLISFVLSGHVAGALLFGCARDSAGPAASRPAVTTPAAPRTPPPAAGPTGAKAFNWIAPSGWADTTVYVRGMNPDNVAALSGPGSAAIIVRMSTSRWTRLEDVPTAAVNEIVLRTLTEMAREYHDVRLIATQPATLSRLPAHMGRVRGDQRGGDVPLSLAFHVSAQSDDPGQSGRPEKRVEQCAPCVRPARG
jgi:hypothetical protein